MSKEDPNDLMSKDCNNDEDITLMNITTTHVDNSDEYVGRVCTDQFRYFALACMGQLRALYPSQTLILIGLLLGLVSGGMQLLGSLSNDLYWFLHSLWHVGVQIAPFLVIKGVVSTNNN
eukprot:GHVO01045903.1.p1 GENE.GHVO01045903.1~~GHVO01045903.1.p1  ORF type:complete len:119 (-),score=9.57 GHVO01045903.1:101-457(-)